MTLWTPSRKLHLLPPTPAEFGRTGIMRGTIELGAWDAQHRIFHQERQASRSPVKGFLQLLLVQARQAAISMTITNGTSQSISYTNSNFSAVAAVNIDTNGIQIGTGSAAVDITDTALATKIAHGTGTGQMAYAAAALDSDVTVADPNCTFITSRNFSNNSGASITVAETGIVVLAGSYNVLAFRDVPTSVAVPDGGGCYVKYTLQISE